MAQYIDKNALVAEIESKKEYAQTLGDNAINSSMQQFYDGMKQGCVDILSFLDTLEVKEVGISIPNIDNTLKKEGLDPDSKEAKVFKESYYMALEKLKAQKGEEL